MTDNYCYRLIGRAITMEKAIEKRSQESCTKQILNEVKRLGVTTFAITKLEER